ncbi:MAG: IPT/TIG domain-containing protein, partial [Cytophagales bacterium]|nr:IPT/TIG domain-containing protein [Cytophagales bacterium]
MKRKIKGIGIALCLVLGTAPLHGQTFSITDFNPKTGPPGTTVTVTGTGFDIQHAGNRIHLGSSAVSVFGYEQNSAGTEFKFDVPEAWSAASVSAGPITVNFNGADHTATPRIISMASFTPVVLSITDFNPKTGPPGTELTITGTGFNVQDISRNRITISSISTLDAHEVNSAGTELKFRVPGFWFGADAAPLRVSYSYDVNKSAVYSTDNFTPVSTTPSITDFSPKTGAPGTEITITGIGFSVYAADNYIHLGSAGYAYAYEVNSAGTELKFRVPETWRSSSATLLTMNFTTSSTATPKSTSTDNFTPVVNPTITDFSPKIGPPGREITVTGTGFKNTARYNSIY